MRHTIAGRSIDSDPGTPAHCMRLVLRKEKESVPVRHACFEAYCFATCCTALSGWQLVFVLLSSVRLIESKLWLLILVTACRRADREASGSDGAGVRQVVVG